MSGLPGRGAWPGSPRPGRLLADSWATTVAQPVASITAAVLVAVVCLVVFATTGQSAAAEQAVIGQIDSTGTRLVTVIDQDGDARIAADGVDDLARLSTVAWAFGLGLVTDVRNADAPIGPGVPLRPLIGEVPEPLRPEHGRMPRAGEAIAGRGAVQRLGLADGAGAVTDGVRTWAVVGTFTATGPLANLDDALLVAGPPPAQVGRPPAQHVGLPHAEEQVRYVYVLAADVAAVDVLADALPAVLPAQNAAAAIVEVPAGAIALREVVAGQLGASSRRLMAVVLGVGLCVVAVTTLGAVAARRRDFGRRRALGATRSAIVAAVLVQTGIAATAGALVGSVVGLILVHRLTGELPATAFSVGVPVLAVLIALAGAVPPAVAAAYRDPVRVLRVP